MPKKPLEDQLKEMVNEYNEKLQEYRNMSDKLNKLLGGIETIDKLIKEKDA